MDVKVPKDIKQYQEKVIFGMSWRQLICTGMALVIVLPLYYFMRKKGYSDDTIGWIVMGVSMPIFSIGWFTFHNMPVEKYVLEVFKFEFLYPKVRKFRIDKLEMEEFLDDMEKERKQQIKVSKRKRKAK